MSKEELTHTSSYSDNEQKIIDAKNKVELEAKLNAVEKTHLLNQEEMDVLRDSLLMRQEERQTAHDIKHLENLAKIKMQQAKDALALEDLKVAHQQESELNAIKHANAMRAERLKGRAMQDEYRDQRWEVEREHDRTLQYDTIDLEKDAKLADIEVEKAKRDMEYTDKRRYQELALRERKLASRPSCSDEQTSAPSPEKTLRRLELYPELEAVCIERIKTFNELYDKVLAKEIGAESLDTPSYDYASQVIALSSVAEIETFYSLYIFLDENNIRKDELTFGRMVDKIANNSFKYNNVVPEISQILTVLWNLIKARNKATHDKIEICDKETFLKFYETFLCFYDYIPELLKLKKQNGVQ